MDSMINSQKNKAVRLIHHRSSSSSRKIDGKNFSLIKKIKKIEKSSSDKRDLLLFSAPSSCLFFDRITVELNTLTNNKKKKAERFLWQAFHHNVLLDRLLGMKICFVE